MLLTLLSEVEVEHGGLKACVAHVLLNDAEIDAGFEEMGGIGVAKGVDGDILFSDSCLELGFAEGALDGGFGHRSFSVAGTLPASSYRREEKARIAVGGPVLTEELQSGVGQRDIAVFGSFAAMNVDHHALGVDVGYFQVLCLLEPEAAGVDGTEEGIVLGSMDAGEQTPDFLSAEHRREAVLGLGSEDAEDVPVPMEDVFVEEFDAAIADTHRFRRPLTDVLAVEEVVLEFLFCDLLGALAVELGEHANGSGVSLLGAFSFAIELEGLDHVLVPVCHHDVSPFEMRFGET